MRSALAGDQDNYKKLLMDLRPWLTAYFSKRLNGHEAEDLAQETLLSLHNKRHTYDLDQPLGPWISAVARYKLIDHLRVLQKKNEITFDESYQGTHPSNEGAFNDHNDLRYFMRCLSAEQAHMVDLVKLQEFSIKEAATKTGHTVSSVKVIIHRSIKKMAATAKKGKNLICL